MNFDHSRRLLFGALPISLLLHLFLLLGWGWARPLPPSLPQPLMQVLVSTRPMVSAAPLLPPSPHSPPPLPVPGKAPPVVSKRSVAPTPPAIDPPIAASETPSPSAPEVREVAAASATEGVAKARPENDSVSVDGLRQYRIELAVAARRFRVYPALARMRGWEGVAEVAVSVNAGLPGPSLKLVKSSGHAVLDEQALDMLARAMAATPLPASLHGRSFVVPMPIRFSLEE